MHKVFLDLKGPLEPSFWTLSMQLFVYIENNQYLIRWVAGSSIISLQLQQIGPLEILLSHPVVNKLTKKCFFQLILLKFWLSNIYSSVEWCTRIILMCVISLLKV